MQEPWKIDNINFIPGKGYYTHSCRSAQVVPACPDGAVRINGTVATERDFLVPIY